MLVSTLRFTAIIFTGLALYVIHKPRKSAPLTMPTQVPAE